MTEEPGRSSVDQSRRGVFSAGPGVQRPGVPETTPEQEMIMTTTLTGRTVAFLVAPEGIEQVELTEPWKAVQDAGGTPRLVSTDSGTVQGFQHLDKADMFDVDDTVDGKSAT